MKRLFLCEQLLECISDFSNEEFQQRVWIRGEGLEVSSFRESLCCLDDYKFQLFIDKQMLNYGFSEKLQYVLREFNCILEKFIKKMDIQASDMSIVDNCNWSKVVDSASRAYDLFKHEIEFLKDKLDQEIAHEDFI